MENTTETSDDNGSDLQPRTIQNRFELRKITVLDSFGILKAVGASKISFHNRDMELKRETASGIEDSFIFF